MDLERYGPFLKSLALVLVDPDLRSKLDVSGVVQQTLMEAYRDREQFRGTTEGELRAWLRQIFRHNMLDRLRNIPPDAGGAISNTSTRIDNLPPASGTSPSSGAARKEAAVQLADAVARLPEDQRSAVELHHLQEYSLEETAERMGKSLGSVASLIHRGVKGLRSMMGGNSRP